MYAEMTGLRANNFCAVCKSSAHLRDTDAQAMFICPVCGKYLFDLGMLSYFQGVTNNPRLYMVSFALRTTSERAVARNDNGFFPVYSQTDFEEMLARPEPQIQDKLRLLLKYLGSTTTFPGNWQRFDAANDYSVICARNAEEAKFYLHALRDEGFVEVQHDGQQPHSVPFKILAKGWLELDRIAETGADSANAFIAMWFDSSRQPFDRAITQAIADAGYVPIRIDRVQHVNRIDDEIIARIRQAKFLVADFTNQNKGVYFEAGFMLGLGRPVIWVCERADMPNVHFDTRQYNTIDYENDNDLKKRLQLRIEALFGRGPHASG